MRWSIEKKIMGAFGLALLLLSIVSGASYQSTTQLIENESWVAHTHKVLEELADILAGLAGAESAQRGYLLTGQESYLEPYNGEARKVTQVLQELQYLTADNPHQQQRLDVLKPLVLARLSKLYETVNLRQAKGFEAAVQFVQPGQGRKLMNDIRKIVYQMQNEERELLKQRERAAVVTAQNTTFIIGLGVLLSFGIIPLGAFAINREIRERKRAEEGLLLRDRAIAAASDTILIAGPPEHDNPIIYANPAFYQLTGYTPEETLGHNCRFLQGPDTDRDVVAKIRTSLQAKQGCQVTLLNYRKDGTPFWNELTLTPTRDASGNVINFIGVSRDVTGRKASEEAMQALTHKLEQSNQELSEFARVASHDLQEPLRKIQAFGDRLSAKGLVQPEGQPYLERMQDAARRMSTLIHDLLALSRVATKMQPFRPVDLTQLAQEVISDLEIRIEEVGGKVELGVLPSIDADPLQIRQLLQNLIGNALKFQCPGVPPVVKVWGLCTPQGCQLIVADNGIGFDEKYKERIFNVFERLHGRSEYQGTGVGLAICRKIVERHGGTIVAESTPGQGSTFTITLPHSKNNL